MADSPLDQLLLELGIDLSPVQKAGEAIKSILSDLNNVSDQFIGKTKEQAAATTSVLSQAKQLATDSITAALRFVGILGDQTGALKEQVEVQKTAAELAKEAAQEERNRLQELREQTRELQKQAEERRQLLAKVVTGVGGAAFGKGVGGLLGAVTGGELISHGIEQAIEGFEKFVDQLKEASVESGKLVQVMDRFNKLAAGAGIDGPEFLKKLSEATEGLVDKFTLAQFGMRALQSGVKGLTPEKISEVTEAVVKLAESSGHTAKQGVDALGVALSRGGTSAGRMLANVTGLTHGELQLANLSPILNRNQRDVEALNHAFAVLIEEAAKLGEVPRTLDQAAQQWKVIKTDLFASFGQGFNESGGMQAFLKFFGEFTRGLESLTDKAKEFGDRLGQAFVLFIPTLQIIESALKLIIDTIEDAVKAFGRMGGSLDKDELIGGIRALGNALFSLKPLVDGFIISIGVLARTMMGLHEIASADLTKPHPFTKGAADVSSAWAGGAFRSATSQIETEQQKKKFNDMMDDVAKAKSPTGKMRGSTQDNTNLAEQEKLLALDKQFDEAKLAQSKAFDALDLAREKSHIEALKQADKERYQSGQESLETYLTNQKNLVDQASKAEIKQIAADLKAKTDETKASLDEAEKHFGPAGLTPDEAQYRGTADVALKKQDTAQGEALRKAVVVEEQRQKQRVAITKEGNAALYAEQHKAITDRLSLVEDGVKAEEALNKQLYDQGAISADQYIQSQMAGIQKLTAAKIQASNDTITTAKANQKYTLELGQAEAAANIKTVQDGIQQLKALQEQVTTLRLGDVTRQFGNQNKGLENQIGLQQQQPGVAFSTSTASLIQTLQKNLQTEMSRLVALANTPEAQANPDTWFKIYEQIQNITEQQLKWNLALQEQLDMMKQVGTGLESIGTAIGTNFQSKFAQSLSKNIETGAKGLQESFKTADIFKGTTAVTPDQKMQAMADKMSAAGTTVTTSYTSLNTSIQALINSFDALTSKVSSLPMGAPAGYGLGDQTGSGEGADLSQLPNTSPTVPFGGMPSSVTNPGPTLQTFTTKLGAAITQVDAFTQSILHSKNALTGAAGGAVGGAGLGNSLGGPIGALFGAIGGGALGAIVGQKNAQLTSNLTNFTDQYKQIMNEFALNTNNLNDTITQLTGLVTQIQTMQSSSKKGSAQYQQLIDQYDAQIMQMEQQQNQIIINMNEMSAVMSAPLGQQSALGGIQSILQQYEQYAGAIQSVSTLMAQGQTQQQAQTEVTNQQAAAYQYLVGAMQAYEQNLVNQLNQDEQQAIQTALQLNDLLWQRQQMMLQYNDQVESVLSAGVLTRQLTRAQTAGQQIEQLTVQYQMQMDQINEQISADQYSVSVATQIFNLAQTRIGLENQLLTAQNYQTTQSMAQIASLQALVTQIQSGNFQSGALGLLLGAIPGSTNGGVTMTPLEVLQTFAGLIASNPAVYAAVLAAAATGTAASSSSSTADAVFASAYQNRASMGYAGFRATNL
jgi:hypothetical protein